MIQTPEVQNQVAQWRAKQLAGTMTQADWREAMEILRQHRTGAQDAAAASRAKSKAPVDVGALKDSLRSLAKKT